jgi:hypothetical protein
MNLQNMSQMDAFTITRKGLTMTPSIRRKVVWE